MTLSFTLTREGVEQQGERQTASKPSNLPSRFIKALKKKEDVSTCPATTLERWSNAFFTTSGAEFQERSRH